MMEQQKVFQIIADEREYQDGKWGCFGHEVGSWLTLMRTHLTKAEEQYSRKAGDYDALDEIRKVAALAVACGEQHGLVPRSPISLKMASARRKVIDEATRQR